MTALPQDPRSFRLFLKRIGFGLICLIWACLYLPNLRTAPGWYGDEFVTLLAGNSVLDGSYVNRTLRYSFFSVFTNYQPLAAGLYALAAKVTGGDMLGARLLAVSLALGMALTAFHTLQKRGRLWTGWAAAILLLAAPQALVHFRWIYPHYFLSWGALIAALLLDSRRTPRREWGIGLACAMGAGAHLIAVHATAAALLARLRYPSAWLRIGIPAGLVFLASLTVAWLKVGPQLFWDLQELAGYYASDSLRSGGLMSKVMNIWRFFQWDLFHLSALFSVFFLLWQRRWSLFVFTALLSFAIIQNRQELPVFYYQAMIFLPLLVLAQAYALQALPTLVQRYVPKLRRVRWMPRLILFLVPCLLLPQGVFQSFAGHIVARNQTWVAPSNRDLEDAAAWLNTHTPPDQMVVAFWNIGWMLKGRWTDILQSAVWEYGSCPAFYPRQRTHAEFLSPASLGDARYIAVGVLDLNWAFHEGTAPDLLEKVGVERWKVVWESPSVVILENPKFLSTP